MRKLAVVALATLGGACTNPDVTGNAEGGIVDAEFSTQRNAFQAAQTHCQAHGRNARITQMPTKGSTVVFECVRP